MWQKGTPPAWRGGGEHGGAAQVQKQLAVARAELLATVATKSGGRRAPPANGSVYDPSKRTRHTIRTLTPGP